MPILMPDGQPATPTAPSTDVLLSVLEQMEENYRQETYAMIANGFGYDNPGYGGSGYGRAGDDIHGTQWVPAGVSEDLTVGFADENALKFARNVCRDLAITNEFAINGHENRVSYIVGIGHTYTVTKKKGEDVPEAWLKAAQMRVDEFLDRNKWSMRQQESVKRRDRDGEVFLRKFDKGDNLLYVRPIEPSLVGTPTQHQGQAEHSFGIHTDPSDVEDVLGYWVEEEEIPASDIQHRKGLVDSNVKRGRPLFYVVRNRLLHAQKLLVNMARTSDTQTAIAMIRRHQQMTSNQADQFKQNFLDKLQATGNLPTQNSSPDNVALYQPGSIIDASQRTEYEFPNHGLDASRYVSVLQALLRSIGAMIQQPEFMFTSDASNANLASTLVSEGPAVKRFQREQEFEAMHDLELIWEDLRMGVDGNVYPAELLDAVEITVGKPDVNVRDRKEEAEVNQIYSNMRVKSIQTISGEQGLDFEQEQENLKDLEPEELPPIVTNNPDDDEGDGSTSGSTADRVRQAAGEQFILEHTPGGHDHDQKKHGRKGSGSSDGGERRGRITERGQRWIDAAVTGEGLDQEEGEIPFGLTDDPMEAGYVLSDGRMLDFSGKNLKTNSRLTGGQGFPAGVRNMDHREIARVMDGDLHGGKAMNAFMRETGAARHFASLKLGGVEVAAPISDAQRRYIARRMREVDFFYDIVDSDGATIVGGDINNGADLANFVKAAKKAAGRNIRSEKERADLEEELIDLGLIDGPTGEPVETRVMGPAQEQTTSTTYEVTDEQLFGVNLTSNAATAHHITWAVRGDKSGEDRWDDLEAEL